MVGFFVVTQTITVIIFIIMPFSICLMELMSHFVNHWPIFLPCLSNRQAEYAEIRLFSRLEMTVLVLVFAFVCVH